MEIKERNQRNLTLFLGKAQSARKYKKLKLFEKLHSNHHYLGLALF